MSEPASAVTAQLAIILRGERVVELPDTPACGSTFLTAAAEHSIEPLLRQHLKATGAWERVSDDVRATLEKRTRREVALETVRKSETCAVFESLNAAAVSALLLKGGALAYTHYAAPWLRPRRDADVLVRKHDRDLASRILQRLGYERINSLSRDAVHAQWMFRRCRKSMSHVVDLHWAVSNRPLFARTLSFEELLADARPITALESNVCGPGPVHALLLACIHRVAHHDDCDNLLWFYDVKLLAERMTVPEWKTFWNLATDKQVATLCADTLASTDRYVGCVVPPHVPFAAVPGPRRNEPSARYLGGTQSAAHSLLLDVRDSQSYAARLRLLASHVFPDAAYMRAQYGARGQTGLAVAYARRGARALWRLVTGSAAA